MTNSRFNEESDVRGQSRPNVLFELIRMVHDAQVGDVIAVISSEEGSNRDLPLWLEKGGHKLLGTEPVDGGTRFICRRAH